MSCNIIGSGAVHFNLQEPSSEAVNLLPNHTDVMNKWSSNSRSPYAFMICKHITSTFTYCLQLLHNTCVNT